MPKVLLLCGSLRSASLNHLLLEYAAQTAPPGITCVHDRELGNLPLYNEELDTAEPPAAVVRFRQAIAEADGVIVASPEYNYGAPGALKNATDWASRPYGRASLAGKAVAVFVATMGASSGFQGSAQLRTLMANLGNFVLHAPLLVVQRAGDKLGRGPGGEATYDDPMGRRLLAANWAALQEAMEKGTGQIALAGARAMAASPKS